MKNSSACLLVVFGVLLMGAPNFCVSGAVDDYRKPGKTEAVTEVIDAIDNNGSGLKTKICRYEYDMPIAPVDLRHKIVLGGVCFDVKRDDYERISELYGARYLASEGKWVPYYASPDDEEILKAVSKVFDVTSKNARGYVRLTDDVIGDENARSRNISYCLFHQAEALCGAGPVMNLVDHKDNTLLYTLNILRSVEFVDADTSSRMFPPAGPRIPAAVDLKGIKGN